MLERSATAVVIRPPRNAPARLPRRVPPSSIVEVPIVSLSRSGRRAAAVDLLLLLTLIALGRMATSGAYAGPIEVIARSAAITAALMLVLAAALGASRRTYLFACALGLPAVITLLRPPAGDRDQLWLLLTNVAVLGAAGMLAAAAGRGAIARRPERVALAVLGVVLGAMAVIAVAGVLAPAWVPAGGVVATTGVVGRLGTTAAALLLIVDGVLRDRSTTRRIGLAFGAGSVAQLLPGGSGPFGAAFGEALVIASAVLFVTAAAELLHDTRSPAARRHRAERGRERTAGIGSGAAVRSMPVLPQLPTARSSSVPGGAAVRPIAADLALLYSAIGQEVDVEVFGDPWVSVDSGELSQLLANLLANCARHAPGARVLVRAAARGPRVRIEVIDDGPGFPPGSTARLLRRGVRGPGSTGAGLGLAICTELVERHRGSFTVVSTSSGCTAVMEFPTASHTLPVQVVPA